MEHRKKNVKVVRVGPNPFQGEDFLEAFLVGPISGALDRIVAAANMKYNFWHYSNKDNGPTSDGANVIDLFKRRNL